MTRRRRRSAVRSSYSRTTRPRPKQPRGDVDAGRSPPGCGRVDLQRAIELQPSSPNTYSNLGLALMRRDSLRRRSCPFNASSNCSRTIRKRATTSGRSWWRLGRYKDAVASLQRRSTAAQQSGGERPPRAGADAGRPKRGRGGIAATRGRPAARQSGCAKKPRPRVEAGRAGGSGRGAVSTRGRAAACQSRCAGSSRGRVDPGGTVQRCGGATSTRNRTEAAVSRSPLQPGARPRHPRRAERGNRPAPRSATRAARPLALSALAKLRRPRPDDPKIRICLFCYQLYIVY